MQVVVSGPDVGNDLERILTDVPKLQPREVGLVILAAARSRVPVDSGRLRASGNTEGMSVRYAAPYSAPIHWGWRKRNIKPNPWLVKASDASVNDWADAFADALQEDIDRTI